MDLVEAMASGDLRVQLTAMRDHLAGQLRDCRRADATAPIARQLQAVVTQLEALPNSERESAVDDLAAARAARRAAAAGS